MLSQGESTEKKGEPHWFFTKSLLIILLKENEGMSWTKRKIRTKRENTLIFKILNID